MLDQWGAQVPHGWVTGDDELGRYTWFRGELRARALVPFNVRPSRAILLDDTAV